MITFVSQAPSCQLLLLSMPCPTRAHDPPTVDLSNNMLALFYVVHTWYVLYVCFWINRKRRSLPAGFSDSQNFCVRTFALWFLRNAKRNLERLCVMTIRKTYICRTGVSRKKKVFFFLIHFTLYHFSCFLRQLWPPLMYGIIYILKKDQSWDFSYCRYAQPCQISFSNSQYQNAKWFPRGVNSSLGFPKSSTHCSSTLAEGFLTPALYGSQNKHVPWTPFPR